VIAVGVGLALGLPGNSATSSGSGGGPVPPAGRALDQVVATTTSVPAATLDTVGAGQTTSHPSPVTGAPLTSGGKPEMLYMGAVKALQGHR
jgi:hypothetical protein